MKTSAFRTLGLLVLGILTTTAALAAPSFPQTSVEMQTALGNGINLGNTFEAYGRAHAGTGAPVRTYETAWGQPVTTEAMIRSFRAAGFDSIRIPVAWTNTMNFETGDYTISRAYLDRVGEVIRWAVDAQMYVILNDHWDGGWWGRFGSARPEIRQAAMDQYRAMWTQIAEAYRDVSEYLIFESANEELGSRLNDKDFAPDSGTLSEDQCYAETNRINQAFVDTIRASGGVNARRFLLIAGYNTDIRQTVDRRFVLPTDPIAQRLLVSVHYYTPSDYCISSAVSTWGTKDDYTQMNALFAELKKFPDAGVGVVIGEYAVALEKDGSMKPNTVDFLTNVLNNCDLYGYSPTLWDCSSLYSRTQGRFTEKAVADLYQARRLAAEGHRLTVATKARQALDAALAQAKPAAGVTAEQAVAWIMYTSQDWGTSYSVGDKYNPGSKTGGIVAVDPVITGPGVYTVSLDFTKTGAGAATGVAFSALAIANGETLFPGFVIDLKQVLINGKPYGLQGIPYTASDDGLCTRVNLYNAWVGAIPKTARLAVATDRKPTAKLLAADTLGPVKTLSITFEYRRP